MGLSDQKPCGEQIDEQEDPDVSIAENTEHVGDDFV